MFRTSTQLTTIRTITSTPTTTTTRRPRSNSDLRLYVLSMYRSPPEETPYPQEKRHDLREDETPVTATEATASRHEHYSEDPDDTPYMDMDVNNNVEDVSEDVSEDAAD